MPTCISQSVHDVQALALRRWEVSPTGSLSWTPAVDSQDSWVFSTPLLSTVLSKRQVCFHGDNLLFNGFLSKVEKGEIRPSPTAVQMGQLRCDNRIAQVGSIGK